MMRPLLLMSCCLITSWLSAQHYVFDFDCRDQKWAILWGQAELVSEGAYKGNALKLDKNTVVSFRPQLKPSSVYKVTAYLRTANDDTCIVLQGIDMGAANFSISSASTSWTKVEQIFYYPVGKFKNPRLEVVFEGESHAWVDEITIERIGDYVPPVYIGIPPMSKREVVTDFGVSMQPDDKVQWMQDAKLGMFIHWGLYAGPADGEWYMYNHGILPDEYRKLAYPESGGQYFDAKDYGPRKWVDLAKKMGAKYINLTAMHHDGFALFESQAINAFTAKQTLNRDLLKEYVDACHEGGMRVGLYKTLINWRYPGYYDVTGTDCKKNNFGYTSAVWHKENARLMKEELYYQVKELMTNYGKIDQLFWDGGWIEQQPSDREGAPFWESYRYLEDSNPWPICPCFHDIEEVTGKPLGLIGMVRKYQPDILMNPRSGWIGDYTCEEGDDEVKGEIRPGVTEKCMSLMKTWGYNEMAEDAEKVMTVQRIKRIFSDCLVRNMNLMINIGPDRHGNVPSLIEQRLIEFGRWVYATSEAIYYTIGGPWQPLDGQYGFCYKGNTIYVYFLGGYLKDSFIMPPVDKGMKVVEAYNVYTKEKVPVSQKGQVITLERINPIKDDITIIAVQVNKNVR